MNPPKPMTPTCGTPNHSTTHPAALAHTELTHSSTSTPVLLQAPRHNGPDAGPV